MADNKGMDALGALAGLGILVSALNGVNDTDAIKRMTASGKSSTYAPGQPEQQKKKNITTAEAAKAVKEVYDAYVAAGFNEVQAFELLKTGLTVYKKNY